jgi:hypothetical protein
MADLDALARRARRAAEWGRLRSASRVALAVVPLALLAALVSRAPAATGGVGLALLAATVALGWRSADGARAARAGLKLGAIPMAAALFTIAARGWCDPYRTVTLCGLGCLAAGVVAGGASAWWAARTRSPGRLRACSEIGLVASLTAALGCVGLGAGSALAVLAALAAGAAAAWLPARARSV